MGSIVSKEAMEKKYLGISRVIEDTEKLIEDLEKQVFQLKQIDIDLNKEIILIEKTIHSKLSDEMKKVSNFQTALREIKIKFSDYKNTTLKAIRDESDKIINLESQFNILATNPLASDGQDAFNDIQTRLASINTEMGNIEKKITDFSGEITTLKTSTLEILGEDFGRQLINNLFKDSTTILDHVEKNFNFLKNINKDFEENFKLLKVHFS